MAIANKDGDNGVVEFQFHSQPQRTKWESVQKAIYDSSTGEFLGRTGKNWGQLLLFYTIFYIVLGALFAICMQGLFASLDDNSPTWQLEESLIGVNPGLGFRPISPRTEEGSLIWYNVTNSTTTQKWISLVEEFLEPYSKDQVGENFVNCNFSKRPEAGKVCVTKTEQFKNCGPENAYGYNSTSPCVFLKLNRIYNWEPIYFTEPEDDMPQELKDHITSLPQEERHQIWITCEGEDSVDKELVSNFSYYPHGFAGYYYPYLNHKNYLSPIIAVEVKNPKPDVVVTVECRAWAKNIIYRGGSLRRAGSVKFEVMVDTEWKTS